MSKQHIHDSEVEAAGVALDDVLDALASGSSTLPLLTQNIEDEMAAVLVRLEEADTTNVRDLMALAELHDLDGADLRGVDLRRQDLSGLSMVGADLRGADLRGACFKDADLRRSLLTGARLDGADFAGAALDQARGLVDGKGQRGGSLRSLAEMALVALLTTFVVRLLAGSSPRRNTRLQAEQARSIAPGDYGAAWREPAEEAAEAPAPTPAVSAISSRSIGTS